MRAYSIIFSVLVIFLVTNMDLGVTFTNSASTSREAQALLNTGWWNSIPENTSKSHCGWPGIRCNKAGSVTDINLSWYNLGGELKKLNFSFFPNLETLRVCYCGVEGSIPYQIGALLKLTHLSLARNKLVGAIPSSIGKLSQLDTLDLYGNQLNGFIPPELGQLYKLRNMDLSINLLRGGIPKEFQFLKGLKYLDLSQNNLFGKIPKFLCKF